ncbi:MAG: hypothetical protein HEEMFOPI_01057 [Holosporales bacterium]
MKKFFTSLSIYKRALFFVIFITFNLVSIAFLNYKMLEAYKNINESLYTNFNISKSLSNFMNITRDIRTYNNKLNYFFKDEPILKKTECVKKLDDILIDILNNKNGKDSIPELCDFLKEKTLKIKKSNDDVNEVLKKLGSDLENGATGDYKKQIKSLENKVKNDTSLYSTYLQLQNAERSLLQLKTDEVQKNFEEEYYALLKLVINSKDCSDEEIEHLKKYKTNFEKYLALIKLLDENNAKLFAHIDSVVNKIQEDGTKGLDKTKKDNDILTKKYSDYIFISALFYVFLIFLLIFISHFFLKSMLSTLKQMQISVKKLAAGESGVSVPGANRQDEIGEMARSLDVIRVTGRKMNEITIGVECLTTGIVITSPDRVISYHNKAFAELVRTCALCFSSFDTSEERFISVEMTDFLNECTYNKDKNIYVLSKGIYYMEIFASELIGKNDEHIGYIYSFLNKSDERYFQKQLENVVTNLLNGDMSQKINTSQITDNFKSISKHFNQVLDIFNIFIDDIALVFEQVANGVLTAQITKNYEGNFDRIKNNINASIKNLNDIMFKVLVTTKTIHVEIKSIVNGIEDLSARTETQATSLQETAAAMVQLASAVQNNTENALNVREMMSETNSSADNGQRVVELSISAMDNIKSSSKEISKIISLIDEIAFQTNLLALNAAVEAARAGDSGKGFAVVAEEVRNLAQRSTEASKQIKRLIDDSTMQVQSGVELVNETGQNFSTILNSIKQVSTLVSDISTASVEQASTLGQINDAITQMDEITQNNAGLVQKSASSVGSLGKYGNNLLALLAQFKIESNKNEDAS